MRNRKLDWAKRLDRIAKRLAIQLCGMRLEGPAAKKIIRESLDLAVATGYPTRPDDEADMISRSVSGLEGRVAALESQVNDLYVYKRLAEAVIVLKNE